MNESGCVKTLHWPWARIIAAAWLFLVFLAALPVALPTSWWFTVYSVFVFDAPAGTPPGMKVDRAIRRPFLATWTLALSECLSRRKPPELEAAVRRAVRFLQARRTARGGWSWHCNATGVADYLPDAELPDPLTLDWWASPQCARLEPGTYLVDSHWRIRLPGWGGTRDVRARSNKFTVTG